MIERFAKWIFHCVILIVFLPCYAPAQSAPTITGMSSSALVNPFGQPVTIQGTSFGASQGTVTFGGVSAAPNSWIDTKIVVPVPAGVAPGVVDVVVTTVNGASSNAKTIKVMPVITACSPTTGVIGTPVTLTGAGFGDTPGTSTVTFKGIPATLSSSSWSNTSITVPVPVGASNGNIVVTINGVAANALPFYVSPNILSLQPLVGPAGTPVTINGNGFGQSQNVVSGVTFNGVSATIGTWSDTAITTTVPAGASTGNVVVTNASNLVSSGVNFTVTAAPTLVSIDLSPFAPSVEKGSQVQFTATGNYSDGSTKDITSTVTWNSSPIAVATITSAGLTTATGLGTATITATSGTVSNSTTLTVPQPNIATLNPDHGAPGTQVILQGRYFGRTQGSGSVSIGGQPATVVDWNDIQIIATVANGAASGNVIMTDNAGDSSNTLQFTLTAPPQLTSITPGHGEVGAQVTLNGSFEATQGAGLVRIGGQIATVVSWSNQAIQVVVPSRAPAVSDVAVYQGGWSNSLSFTVDLPILSSLSVDHGTPGTQVVLSGSNFGGSQGNGGTVMIGGRPAQIVNWSDGQIAVTVVTGATTGNATVYQGGTWSNSLPFTVPTAHIDSISASQGAPGTQITFNGSGFGTQQGSGSVTLGNQPASVISWADGQIVASVNNAAAGNGFAGVYQNETWSNYLPFNVPASATSVTLTPANLAMLVGETKTLKLADQNGGTITGATWTVDNSAILTLSTDDPPVLTAQNSGTATVTASAGSLSAHAKVNVYVAGSNGGFSPGTVLWSVPPASGYSGKQILQAVPTGNNTADLFGLDTDTPSDARGHFFLRGLTADGQQLWSTAVNPAATPPGTSFNYLATVVPGNLGDALVFASIIDPNRVVPATVTRLDGQAGVPAWQYPLAPSFSPGSGGSGSSPAIGPDGTIYMVEAMDLSSFTSPEQINQTNTMANLVALDGNTGTPKWKIPLPNGHYYLWQYILFWDYDTAPQTGPVTVLPDGSVTLEALTLNRYETDVPAPGYFLETWSIDYVLNQITVRPDMSVVTTKLREYTFNASGCHGVCSYLSYTYTPGEVIPDGQGGTLASFAVLTNNDQNYSGDSHVTHVDASGNKADFVMNSCTGFCGAPLKDLVLGENNTAYGTTQVNTNSGATASQLTAFDINSGAPKWTWQAPQGHSVRLVMAETDDGLVTKDLDQNGNETIASFDSSGAPVYDTSLGSSLSDLDYWTLGEYLSVGNDPANLAFKKVASTKSPQPATTSKSHPRGKHKNGDSDRPEILHFVTNDPAPPTVTLQNYRHQFEQVVSQSTAPSKYFLGDDGTVPAFLSAVHTPMDMVGFIGHAAELPACGTCTPPTPIQSYGLVFGVQPDATHLGKWFLLRISKTGDNPGYNPPSGPNVTLVNKIETRAPIIFIGSCRINPMFEDLWDITDQSKYRALIVPAGNTDVHAGVARDAWREIARSFAAGDDIQQAVVNANKLILSLYTDPAYMTQWKVIGGTDSKGNYIRWTH